MVHNRGGRVECVYTGQTARVPPIPPQAFNVEHTWPRSRGADTLPPLSDLHHLFPTLAEANERRSNLPFGLVRQILWELGGSRYGFDSVGREVFEPRDGHKGDAARALFYVALRYGNMTGFLTAGHEALLRQWHWQDTVDEWERERTRRIAQLQGRANPFVERPQLVERLYRIGGPADAPVLPVVLPSDTLLEYRGQERRWRLRLACLNTGWTSVELRGIEPLVLPDSVTVTWLSADSSIAAGRVGWISIELSGKPASDGTLRFRIRFAAGVRPLEVTFRIAATTGATVEPPHFREDILSVRWRAALGTETPRLFIYTLLGQSQEVVPLVRQTKVGELELQLPRHRLPRGWLLLCLKVGQQMWWTWTLNP